MKDPGAKTNILAKTFDNNSSIVPELTLQQRKMDDKLRKVAEMRNSVMSSAESLNWIWVLVGVRGQGRLIKRQIQSGGYVRGERNYILTFICARISVPSTGKQPNQTRFNTVLVDSRQMLNRSSANYKPSNQVRHVLNQCMYIILNTEYR